MATTISGYRIGRQIYESSQSLIYRAHREADDRPVILKMLKQTYPTPEKIAWFCREFEMTRSLDVAGVVDAYDLFVHQHRWVMVLEDFHGESLDLLQQARPFSVEAFLPLALRMADILGQIHQRHVMHKDINPSNIVMNPSTGVVKLIDFGISTALSRENPSLRNPEVLEGTLAYVSPEQTGRMNRAVDYRTDFYSLGATFYELLTGEIPFPDMDRMELVHAHIARQPVPPLERNPGIPPALSDIVMKLMAKNAEDRYQSAFGLSADLETCLSHLRSNRSGEAFELGKRDVSEQFQVPQKLYGRSSETEMLLDAFERVSEGASEMMLVAGYSGIGKSALVQEIYKPITRDRGYFVAGKFNQFQVNIPYSAVVQTFRALVQQILTEPEKQIASWREKLEETLGSNGRVMVDVIPELELIIGPQSEVPHLPARAAQNRFNLVLQNFIRVFTQPEHPLVLFLDDLQWTDAGSLNLLRVLMTASDQHHLFVIGAYRDNEVSDGHPLTLVLDEIEKNGGVTHTLVLKPLGLPDVVRFTADTVKCTTAKAESLGKLVFEKTGGNPFFMGEFLKSLYTKELLSFDTQHGVWKWDIEQIHAHDVTENVVDLMVDNARRLDGTTQEVLKWAACIGNRFDLQTLATIYEKPPREIASELAAALDEGMVVPLADAYKLMELEVEGLADAVTAEYRFAHDRVQQAAYMLIPEPDRPGMHLRVGQLLLQNTPSAEQDLRIFDIVNQLNLGRGLIDRQPERDELARLNLQAGRKARASIAYQPAFGYLQIGVDLLEEEHWQQHYELALALHQEAAEAAYLIGDYEEMARRLETVRKHARTTLNRVDAYEIELLAHSAQNQLLEGIEAGLKALDMLDIHLPDKPTQDDVIAGLEKTMAVLGDRPVEALADLPEMTDPGKIAAINILLRLFIPAFNASPELFSLIVFELVQLSVQYGNAPSSARAYAAYGLILCGVVGDIESGYRFGSLSLDLVERFNAREIASSTLYIVACFIKHWKEPLLDTVPLMVDSYQQGLETGDLEFAALAAFSYTLQAYWGGQNLPELESETARYGEALIQLRQTHFLSLNNLYHQVISNLSGQVDDPCALVGNSYDETAAMPLLLKANNMNELCYLHLNKLVLGYLFQNHSQAVEQATKTEKYLLGAVGTIVAPVYHFYDSLTQLAMFSEADESNRASILTKVTANQEKLRTWANHAPSNFQHKWHLVEAERARVQGADHEARDHYDRAIALAQKNRYLNEEALACELAAQFYLAGKDLAHVARHYLSDAHYAYQRWGAMAKVHDLETRYPQLVAGISPETPIRQPASLETTSDRQPSSTLDLVSVLKVSQAISGEIVLDRLMTRLMKIALENAGAEKGVLILEREGRLVIEIEGTTEEAKAETEVLVLQSIPVETSENLSKAVVNYVARTGESVVLSDATCEGIFTTDAYVLQNRPKSILCAPLVNQGNLIGILYLENNLTTGAFTPDRLEVLKLLSSQAAISLENAGLYANLEEAHARLEDYSKTLEQRVEERTLELQKKNRQLETANRQVREATERKSAFLASMSHELRTPMTAILGFTRLVLRRGAKELSGRNRENLEKVRLSGEHLLHLINDILDLSKIESGRMDVTAAPFDVRKLVLTCCATVSPLVKPGVKLDYVVSENAGEAHTDEARVRQMVINLLSNATRFTEKGEIKISAVREGAFLVFSVADTGSGMPEEALRYIFDEFRQVKSSDRQHGGTGLGLSITKKFAELLGGTVSVESQVGKGSTFTLRVPAIYNVDTP